MRTQAEDAPLCSRDRGPAGHPDLTQRGCHSGRDGFLVAAAPSILENPSLLPEPAPRSRPMAPCLVLAICLPSVSRARS